jgi:hypothetical protein
MAGAPDTSTVTAESDVGDITADALFGDALVTGDFNEGSDF